VIMGVVLFGTFCVIVLNLVVDLLYTAIDPRSRLHHTDFEGSGAPALGRRQKEAPSEPSTPQLAPLGGDGRMTP
jgi:hypothetical protein